MLAVSAEGATANLVLKNELGWWARFDSPEEVAARLGEIHDFFANGAAEKWSIAETVLQQFDGRRLSQQVYDYLIA